MAGIFNYDQQPFSQPKSSVSVSHVYITIFLLLFSYFIVYLAKWW